MTDDALVKEFDDRKSLFEDFTLNVEKLVGDLLRANGIRVHSVSSRVKSRDSLQHKIQSGTYTSLTTITDIAGIRIITYFEDEVDSVAAIIEQEFELDRDNSVDKRKLLDPDRFGYLSLHYVCRLSAERRALSEYRVFADLKCEIQIRSILQHTWAEIEHDLGYKTPLAVPYQMRRKFSRLAGMLELADSEFAGIRDAMRQYGRDVPAQIESRPATVLIDVVSLAAFVDKAPIVQQVDSDLAIAVGAKIVADIDRNTKLSYQLVGLRKCGLKTIADIQQSLQASRGELPTFLKYYFSLWHDTKTTPVMVRGASITALVHLCLSQKGDADTQLLLWRIFGAADSPESRSFIEKLILRFRVI